MDHDYVDEMIGGCLVDEAVEALSEWLQSPEALHVIRSAHQLNGKAGVSLVITNQYCRIVRRTHSAPEYIRRLATEWLREQGCPL